MSESIQHSPFNYQPSNAAMRIKSSIANAASKRANLLAKEGRDIINLTTGEPDFPTPDYVIKAAYEAMIGGKTRYTAVEGSDELKQAIVQKLKRENGLTFSNNEVMASAGAKQVLFNAVMAIMNPGDEAIIITPSWLSYREMIEFSGGIPVSVRCDIEFNQFINNLESAINKKTKLIILNSPNNPSGKVFTRKENKELGELFKKYPNTLILCDEIYEHIVYTEDGFTSLLEICPELKNQVLIINGVSKSYSMTGWRLGFGAGPKELISEMVKIQSQSTSCPCSISQAAAVAALNNNNAIVVERNHEFLRRRNLLINEFSSIPGVVANKPDGAFYLLLECSQIIDKLKKNNKEKFDDTALVDKLLSDIGVAFVQGTPFDAPSNIRMSFAAPENKLIDACGRLRKFCTELNL